jgi:hypothetical protein
MEQFFVWLKGISSSPFLTIGSFVLTIFAIVLALFFYIRSRRNKEPVYTKKGFNIVQDFSAKLSDLVITYKNQTVNNLTITKLAFWNDGHDTINKIDIAEGDPLRICAIEDSKILSAEVIYSRNSANRFCISNIEDDNLVRLSFDYLDKDEGGIIQIIHNGKSSEDIEVKGTIKGAGKPVFRWLPSISPLLFPIGPSSKLKRKHFGYIAFFTSVVVTAIGIGIILFSEKEKSIGWVMAITYGITLIPVYFMFLRRRVPKEFEIIEKEF